MDGRLIHLVRASLSDIREQGRKYEVYMLDLSQFSSVRFKLRIKTLDFQKGDILFLEKLELLWSLKEVIPQYDCQISCDADRCLS